MSQNTATGSHTSPQESTPSSQPQSFRFSIALSTIKEKKPKLKKEEDCMDVVPIKQKPATLAPTRLDRNQLSTICIRSKDKQGPKASSIQNLPSPHPLTRHACQLRSIRMRRMQKQWPKISNPFNSPMPDKEKRFRSTLPTHQTITCSFKCSSWQFGWSFLVAQ